MLTVVIDNIKINTSPGQQLLNNTNVIVVCLNMVKSIATNYSMLLSNANMIVVCLNMVKIHCLQQLLIIVVKKFFKIRTVEEVN